MLAHLDAETLNFKFLNTCSVGLQNLMCTMCICLVLVFPILPAALQEELWKLLQTIIRHGVYICCMLRPCVAGLQVLSLH